MRFSHDSGQGVIPVLGGNEIGDITNEPRENHARAQKGLFPRTTNYPLSRSVLEYADELAKMFIPK